ncbi:MAG TPA: hypothetical protein VFJ74_08445 [Gemmatimonadaceae bacterium]|nr:hypothetical protein [Gemmatimonadaceae bacterium]
MSAPPPQQPPLPYGPNTDAVRRLLQRLAAAPAEAWDAAAAHYEALARTPRYAAAERALATAVTAAGRERERDAIVGPLVQIAGDAAERVLRATSAARPGTPTPHASPEDAEDESANRFAEPALAAALALVVRDVLPQSAFEALYEAVGGMVRVEELGKW